MSYNFPFTGTKGYQNNGNNNLGSPSFSAFGPNTTSGYSNLYPSITINGATVTGTVFKASDASAGSSTWTANDGTVLNRQTFNHRLSYGNTGFWTNPNDTYIWPDAIATGLYNDCDFYTAANNTDLDIGTEDFIIEMVFCNYFNYGSGPYCKRDTNAAGWKGIAFDQRITGNQCVFNCSDGTNSLTVGGATGVHGFNWIHYIGMANRSYNNVNSFRHYFNGAYVGAGNIYPVGSLSTPSNKAKFGSQTGDYTPTAPSSLCMAFFGLWKRADWFSEGATGTTEMNTIASQRYSAFIGGGFSHPLNTSYGGSWKYARKTLNGVTTYHPVGYGHIDYALDPGETERSVLVERQSTNLLGVNTYFSDASWTKTNCAIGTDTVQTPFIYGAGPPWYYVSNKLTADGVNGEHSISKSSTLASSSTIHTYSIFAKASDCNYVGIYDEVISDGIMFNLSNGTVGSTYNGGSITGRIIDHGNGWYRCTMTATTGNGIRRIIASKADWQANGTNSHYFVGDSVTRSLSITFAQLEALPYATSPIISTGAGTTTRTASNIVFIAGNDTETIKYQVAHNGIAYSGGNRWHICELTGGNDYHLVGLTSGGTQLYAQGTKVGAFQYFVQCSNNILNTNWHECQMHHRTNFVNIYADGVSATPDTSCNPPTAGTYNINIGASNSLTDHLDGRIKNIRIWQKIV